MALIVRWLSALLLAASASLATPTSIAALDQPASHLSVGRSEEAPPTVGPPTVPHKVTVDPKTLEPAPPAKTVPEGGPSPTEPPPKRTPVPDPVIQLRERPSAPGDRHGPGPSPR